MKLRFENYLDRTFGKITVLEFAGMQGAYTQWLGQCACGTLVTVPAKNGRIARKMCDRCREEDTRKIDTRQWISPATDTSFERLVKTMQRIGPSTAPQLKKALGYHEDIIYDCFAQLLDEGKLRIGNSNGQRVYILK